MEASIKYPEFNGLSDNLRPFLAKYQEFIKSGNYYNMLLSVKTDLRKISRKNQFDEYLQILSLASNLFVENKEHDNARSLIMDSLEELEKSSCKAENIQIGVCKLFSDILQKEKRVFDSNLQLMTRFFQLFETKKIEEKVLFEHEIYELFTKTCLDIKNYMSAYKLALKSSRLDLLEASAEGVTKKFFPTEKDYFYARTVFELLAKNKLELAKDFLFKKMDMTNKLQNNNPILNFTYFLIFILQNENKEMEFANLEILIKKYRIPIELDPQMIKYLNLISKNHYNKELIKEDEEAKKGGMNLGNLLKMFG